MRYSVRFLCLLLLLSGCKVDGDPTPSLRDKIERAPVDYTCTSEQMQKAEEETAFCNNHTSYYTTVCYGMALIRNCTKRVLNEQPHP